MKSPLVEDVNGSKRRVLGILALLQGQFWAASISSNSTRLIRRDASYEWRRAIGDGDLGLQRSRSQLITISRCNWNYIKRQVHINKKHQSWFCSHRGVHKLVLSSPLLTSKLYERKGLDSSTYKLVKHLRDTCSVVHLSEMNSSWTFSYSSVWASLVKLLKVNSLFQA